jgi:hypothetical protein
MANIGEKISGNGSVQVMIEFFDQLPLLTRGLSPSYHPRRGQSLAGKVSLMLYHHQVLYLLKEWRKSD